MTKERAMKTLMPWRKPVTFFSPVRQDWDEMFQRFFGNAEETGTTALASWAPQVDVEETSDAILVKADLPGVDPKDIEINVQDRTLTLRGEKHEEREDKQKQFHRIERFAGSFFRSIPLPVEADMEKISATSNKGVVTVTIPKKASAQPRKVAVKAKD